LPSGEFFKDQRHSLTIHRFRQYPSSFLDSRFSIDIYLPPEYDASGDASFPVLFFNDGQDMEQVRLAETLHKLYASQKIPSIIVVAIHAAERLQEYGVAQRADYRNRGSKARHYAQFIVNELIPQIKMAYSVSEEKAHFAFAGFSLGGLSAMDIGWHHPQVFGRVGVFSGSFWWRYTDWREDDPDGGRIMHELLRQSEHRPGMKFWFQTGTLDETDDRNNNGIIDAIDDTLDIIRELTKLGYQQGKDIHYQEVEGGRHHPATWAEVLPDFLTWAFGR
jgi:enterochelin esterase-like enzyme